MTTLWVTVIEPTSLEEHFVTSIYPNPAKGPVNIQGTGQVFVVNTLGQIVWSQWMDGIEALSLPKGLYIVRMENVNGISTKKLIVE